VGDTHRVPKLGTLEGEIQSEPEIGLRKVRTKETNAMTNGIKLAKVSKIMEGKYFFFLAILNEQKLFRELVKRSIIYLIGSHNFIRSERKSFAERSRKASQNGQN